MNPIEMVDLKSQFAEIKSEVMAGIERVCTQTTFINGSDVKDFAENLQHYTKSKYVIPCANGTDALQIALMSLGLIPSDEVIVPTWTYVATAEVIALLGLRPIFIDADPISFNIDITQIESSITPKTKAIVPVHLYGQCCDMEAIMEIAKKHNLFVVEDTAQAIGAEYTFKSGLKSQAGTIGHVGTTSFFPSKNLGCYGDGGAIMTNDETLAKKMKAICDHGQTDQKYYHNIVGVNSRLDSIQAVVLNAKLKHLKRYEASRNEVAQRYSAAFEEVKHIISPAISSWSTHVFHQYTVRITNGKRNALKEYLMSKNIPSMIYYPLPLHHQKAYHAYLKGTESLQVSEQLATEVISLPIHTEMKSEQQEFIIEAVKEFMI
ncbi:MAG: DegT/DnrJ/EryC1/StrS family aminotransferase [Chitinophagales bacterium]